MSQRITIFSILFAICYLLFAISQYWLADYHYAASQKDYQLFIQTQNPQFLVSAYQEISTATKLNKSEPTITSQNAIVTAYLAAALNNKDATTAAELAQISASIAQNSISQSPHHPNYYKSAARVYILLSDINPKYMQLAADTLKSAIVISPTDPRLPYNLGVIYHYLGRDDLAKQYLNQALKLKPDFGDAQQQLEQITKKN